MCLEVLVFVLISWGFHTKVTQTRWLKQIYFLTIMEARERSEVMVSAVLVSSEASLVGLEMVIFSSCPHMVFLCEDTYMSVPQFPLFIGSPAILD